MTTPEQPLHRQLGMTDDELAAVTDELGREPTHLELAMYSVMWSEHCSYKSSRSHLGRLPTDAPWVLVGPGEGAGVIDVGDGLAVAIRIESHNHPSAVEPYQGAATGVGGIIRDIFSMGARPIAVMDPLRFGPLDDPRTRYLFEGVVSGISGYGNAVGVPTVGGEVVFDECYAGNPLVNVLCLGVLPKERLVLARAEGVGNLAVLMGSSTGRDGIGGASVLASAGFVEGSETKRPSVQVGDPFEEKKLIEACLALLDAGLAIGVQDLGAAGLSCAASETAAKTGAGMDVDAARVSRREPGMNPVELLTSESQERMLAIVTPDNLDEVLALCERWEIRATVVGRVTDSGRFRVYDGYFDAIGVPGANPLPPLGDAATEVSSDRIPAADVPIGSLGDGPLYHRPLAPPAELATRQDADPGPELATRFPPGSDLSTELLGLLAAPNIADKSWVWRQYDHQLFLNTVTGPGGDASVLRLKETAGRALALVGGRQGAVLCAGPAHGRAARGPRGGPQRRVHRRAPDGAGELPELRQPGARGSDVAVLGGGRRHGRRVPGAGSAGGRWERQLLQRVTRPGHRPDAGGRRGRSHRRARLASAGDRAARGRPDRHGGRDPFRARRLGVGDEPRLAQRAPTARGSQGGRAPPRSRRRAGDRSDRRRDPRLLGRRARGCAGRDGDRLRGGFPGDDRRLVDVLLGVRVARVVLSVGPDQLDEVLGRAGAAGVPATVLGDAGGSDLHADGAFTVPVATATSAWRDAIPSIMAATIELAE